MKTDKAKIAGSLSLIAGLWLALYGILMGAGFTSNIFIVGILIALVSLFEVYSVESTKWVSVVNGILGAWLLISPMFLAGLTMGATLNSVILGLIVLGVSIWGGVTSSSTMGIGHPKMG